VGEMMVMMLKIHCQCTAKQHQSDAYNFVQGLCPITKKTLNHIQATN